MGTSCCRRTVRRSAGACSARALEACDLQGNLLQAPGFRDQESFAAEDHTLVELPVVRWGGWLFGHAVNPVGSDAVPSFPEHMGEFDRLISPYRSERLVLADRHSYEVAANWKVVAVNYHECYHCPLIHPELLPGLVTRLEATTTTCRATSSAGA